MNGSWKDARSPGTGGRGLASFFAFLRSGARPWRSAGSASVGVDGRLRPGALSSSTLPPCTCGLGGHFDPPLSVAQQVRIGVNVGREDLKVLKSE